MRSLALLFLIGVVMPLGLFAQEPQKFINQEVKKKLLAMHPQGKFRLDNVFQEGDQLWLALIPRESSTGSSDSLSMEEFPAIQKDPFHNEKNTISDYMFSNGVIYTPISNKTIKSFAFYNPLVQAQLMKNTIAPEFVVPDGFLLPRDLALLLGHLPLPLRKVELATEKEARYKELLTQELEAADLQVLVYDSSSGDMQIVDFKPQAASATESVSVQALRWEGTVTADSLSLISQIKKQGKSIYFVDYNLAKVFELKRKEKSFILEEKIALQGDAQAAGLQDFITSLDAEQYYLLSNKDSKLRIFDRKGLQLKEVALLSNPSSMITFSRSPSEQDYIVVASKGTNEIMLLDSLSFRTVRTFAVPGKPISMLSDEKFLYVASKGDKTPSFSVIDWVTKEPVLKLDLEHKPDKILFTATAEHILILHPYDSSISVFNVASQKIDQVIDLGANVLEPKDMIVSHSGKFLLVGSSDSLNLAVVSLDTFELIKEIELEIIPTKLILLDSSSI